MKIRTLILTLFFLPSIAWADTVNSFPQLADGKYTLVNGTTYQLTSNVNLQGYLYIPSGSAVTINTNVYQINRKLGTADPRANGQVILNEGTLIIEGNGDIVEGSNSSNGGGIINQGNLTINGGVSIWSCKTSGNGGGIYNSGTLTMNGGTIRQNTRCQKGAGIYNADTGILNIKGGTITTNSASVNGSGIYNEGTLNIEGNLSISGNTNSNIYLPTGKVITITNTLANTSAIGVTMESPGVFTSGLSGMGDFNIFSSDESTTVELKADGSGGAKLETYWSQLNARFTADGTVTLDKNYIAHRSDGPLTIASERTVTLALANYTLNRNLSSATVDGCVIKNEGNLTITGTGTITGGFNSGDGGGINNSGTLNLQGGSIQNNKVASGHNGGGIYHSGTTLSMQGTITVNNNKIGNANNNVYLCTGKTITISAAVTSSDNSIGISHEEAHAVFTTNLNGTATTCFFADVTTNGIGPNSTGGAIVGRSYNITPSCVSGSISVKTTAVKDEWVTMTLTANTNYIPITLTFSPAATTVTYPKNGNYSFTMPESNVNITGVCKQGGYCGTTDHDEDMKYYYDSYTLYFITKDDQDVAMANYSQNNVPWKTLKDHTNSINISNHVTSLSDYAFWGYNKLTSITIPASVTSIGTFALSNCTKLTTITVDNANSNYSSGGGALFNKAGTHLICYPAGIEATAYTLPASVQEVTDGAFIYNSHLYTIEVAEGNTHFVSDEGILYNSGKTTLYYCPEYNNKSSYTIATTVTAIKPYAFFHQSVMSYLYVTQITPPTAGASMFEGAGINKIMVKHGYKSTYQSAWSSYSDLIYEMDLANAAITLTTDANEYDYLGSAVTPSIQSVVDLNSSGPTLVLNTDYTAAYSNNNAVGTGTLTLTGMGNYAETSTTKDFVITKRIVIENATGNYSTYYSDLDLAVPSGLTACTITAVDWTNGTTSLSANLSYIPANIPILFYKSSGTCNGTYHAALGSGTSPSPSPDFMGVLDNTAYADLIAGKQALYVMRGGIFNRVNSGTLHANRCYLAMPNPASTRAPGSLSIGIVNENTTGIEEPINVSDDVKSEWYTLDGCRLQGRPTQKGVYISKGKKLIVK